MAEFNLIDDPWIPCISLDGGSVELGIRDTLLKAHELGELCDDSPLVTVSIHRLLLAILYRAFQGPSDMSGWKKLYRAESFDGNSELSAYLEEWRDRFWLFHEHHPFMQVAGLDLNEYKADDTIKTDKSDGLMRLVREAPDKGGRVLFDHRVGTERPEYDPRHIATMLLAAHSFDGTGNSSGGAIGATTITSSYRQFAPCVEGLCLWLQGENLFRTLLLNLVPIDVEPNDFPAWEDPGIVKTVIESWTTPVRFAGPVQRFAALSRFIRVVDRRAMFYTNGLKTAADANDPMKAYSRPNETAEFTAIKLGEDRAAWRDAHSLFSLSSSSRKPPPCLNHAARLLGDGTLPRSAHPRANVVGLATDRGKSFLWRHERMPVPISLLGDDDRIERLKTLIDEAERVGDKLDDLDGHLIQRTRRIAMLYLSPTAEDSDGREPDKKDIAKMVDAIDPRPAYWSRLEKHFFDLLENLPGDWDANAGEWKADDQQSATRAWREAVKHQAKRALQESIRSLGTTARAIAAAARVPTTFTDDDLKPKSQNGAVPKRRRKGAGKGGSKT